MIMLEWIYSMGKLSAKGKAKMDIFTSIFLDFFLSSSSLWLYFKFTIYIGIQTKTFYCLGALSLANKIFDVTWYTLDVITSFFNVN